MRALCFSALLLVAACTSPVPELPLTARFEHVAFEPESAEFYGGRLWRWGWPIRVKIVGSEAYRDLVEQQLAQLSDLTGQPVVMDADRPNLTIEFSRRNRDWYCVFQLTGTPRAYTAYVYIATDQPQRHVRRCVAQELSQAMGLFADTDGRRDTAFSSAIGTDYLTEADLALFAILYDGRLRAGMHRDEAMPIVRQIVAEIEQEQEAGR